MNAAGGRVKLAPARAESRVTRGVAPPKPLPAVTFLATRPVPIHDVNVGGAWAPFRVDSERRQLQLFRTLVGQELMLTVGLAGGPGLQAHLWARDSSTGALTLRLARREDRARMVALLGRRASGERAPHTVWAATYLGEHKLQFELPGAALGDAAGHPVLFATRPRLLLEMPRRTTERMPNRVGPAPVVRFHHPLAPDQAVTLSVLDVSRGGCALWRPRGLIPLSPGMDLRRVEVELDDETLFFTDLNIVSATAGPDHLQTLPMGEAEGLRLGCAWLDLPEAAAHTLEGWLRRGRLTRGRAALDDVWLERISLG